MAGEWHGHGMGTAWARHAMCVNRPRTVSNASIINGTSFFPQFPHPADLDLQVFVIRFPPIRFYLPPQLDVEFF
jgi:hypothetical protein